MCMWTKLSTKITNKIKIFPTYLIWDFLGHETPNKNIFKTGPIVFPPSWREIFVSGTLIGELLALDICTMIGQLPTR